MGAKGHKAQTFTFEIDENYTSDDREAIAEDVIDEIVDNTLKQKDKNGEKMAPLSNKKGNSYKKFKRSVVGTGAANLKFTGEMLGSLRFIKSKSSKGKITVGYSAGTTQNAKAKGHITGDVGKKRDFLGLQNKNITKILKKYPVEDKEEKKKAIKAALALREKLRGKKDS